MEGRRVPLVNLHQCDSPRVDKFGRLRLSSEAFGYLPEEFFLESHFTGRVVLFQPIGIDHPDYDEDGWDGEMAIYEPAPSAYPTRVKTVVVYNQW